MRLFPTAVEKFFEDPNSSITKESSRASVRTTARLFQQDHPDLELHQITSDHIEKWIGSRRANGVSDVTAKKYLQRLRSVFRWGTWKGHVSSNPTDHLEQVLSLRPQAVRKNRWLDEAQVRRILDSVEILTSQDHRDALILRLGFTAGLRNGEIRTLPISALESIENQQVMVSGKNDKLAQVGVPEKTAELLMSWRDQYEDAKPHDPVIIKFRNLKNWTTAERSLTPQWGESITQQAVGRIVAARTEAAGLRVSPHDMRRSYASILEKKTDVVAISRALRHSNIATTQTYFEQRQDAAFQAARSTGLDL